MPANRIAINRAPVLTLWAAVVAERLGYDRESALTLGKAVAGLNAQSKGQRLGIFGKPPERPIKVERKKERTPEKNAVTLLGRIIPVVGSGTALRASIKGEIIDPKSVSTYLAQKFGENLGDARAAMEELAKSIKREKLAVDAFGLYEKFRPSVPEGVKRWGVKGELDLETIRSLTR